MFLNKTLFKKFIKSSFKWEGLVVGRVFGGLVVAGGTWVTWTEEGYVPNWLKAAVMEYTGELPGKGYMFKAKKDEPIQYEISDNVFYDLPERFRRRKFAYTVTPIILQGTFGICRVIQQNSTMRMIAVAEKYHEIIDLSELGEENAPSGPASITSEGEMLMYKNEHSAYGFLPADGTIDIVRKIMDHVDSIAFSEEGF